MIRCASSSGRCIGTNCTLTLQCDAEKAAAAAAFHPSSCMCPECLPRNRLPPAPRKHGCHNRPPLGVKRTVQDGYYQLYAPGEVMPLNPQFTLVPFTMTTDCQYTTSAAGATDPACKGCNWRKPHA